MIGDSNFRHDIPDTYTLLLRLTMGLMAYILGLSHLDSAENHILSHIPRPAEWPQHSQTRLLFGQREIRRPSIRFLCHTATRSRCDTGCRAFDEGLRGGSKFTEGRGERPRCPTNTSRRRNRSTGDGLVGREQAIHRSGRCRRPSRMGQRYMVSLRARPCVLADKKGRLASLQIPRHGSITSSISDTFPQTLRHRDPAFAACHTLSTISG